MAYIIDCKGDSLILPGYIDNVAENLYIHEIPLHLDFHFKGHSDLLTLRIRIARFPVSTEVKVPLLRAVLAGLNSRLL